MAEDTGNKAQHCAHFHPQSFFHNTVGEQGIFSKNMSSNLCNRKFSIDTHHYILIPSTCVNVNYHRSRERRDELFFRIQFSIWLLRASLRGPLVSTDSLCVPGFTGFSKRSKTYWIMGSTVSDYRRLCVCRGVCVCVGGQLVNRGWNGVVKTP